MTRSLALPVRAPGRRIRASAAAAALLVLAGCRVPLKTPPIQSNGPVPVIDWSRLAEFAKAAGAVYGPTSAIESAYGKPNVVVRDLPNTDGRYFIYFDHRNKTQTIVVRGTTNRTNVWSDIDAFKVLDPALAIFIHRGFKMAADDAYADMAPLLQRDYATRITGHSLGGAIAAILMLDLDKDGYKIDEVVTFGQPKFTNAAGGKNVTLPYYRVIDDGDIVAQIPPSDVVYDLSGPYAHFGPEITLKPDHTFTYSPVPVPRAIFDDDAWKTLQPDDVADHQINLYIDRISSVK